ncbi:metalloregulator ArsR/SmtB family transcription factor [Agrococcus sp. HG114]|uniref:metalloregulator ArsR/SmtB family transcription factor n=1 Tax=Agrococcus sp. HG114 TaxID=2969757 RepID=UPI00215B1EB1|nr:metalloregulator ArsR/SmtB family transcription factor [Agrococcus sp. HG114]MCR8670043.1 metalloregulator ArsR/SmtB family transcription factor [Agrococcus sp. HG114]
MSIQFASTVAASTRAIDAGVALDLAATLRALADPLRLRMLSLIASDPRGEACVVDLAELAEVSQPTVSHHLKVLREAGVLRSERRGTWVWYSVEPGLQPAVVSLLEGFAPAAARPGGASPEPLGDVDEALEQLASSLAERFPTVSADAVTSIVRESYAALAKPARTTGRLVPRTERFAAQRLTDLTRDRRAHRPQVLFVCVANAGRSQLAAALVEHRSGGSVVARSAGSSPAAELHPEVRGLIEHLGPEIAERAFPKPITDDAVRAADVVITMGCGDVCPIIPGVRYDDWAIGDPALASPEGVVAIHDDIAARVDRLLAELTETVTTTTTTT